MKVRMSGGPFDDTTWDYPSPLPESIMLFDAQTLAYHEYVGPMTWLPGNVASYRWAGCVGRLPVPTDLDEEVSSL